MKLTEMNLSVHIISKNELAIKVIFKLFILSFSSMGMR